jgi:hypothetical protein
MEIAMSGDEISGEGRHQRFARWEQLGLDQVKSDLENGGHRVVGGPPAVRALAWEWVRMKEAGSPSPPLTPVIDVAEIMKASAASMGSAIRLSPTQVAPSSSAGQRPELITLKPTFMGNSIDLKELWRRVWPWLKRRLHGPS